MSKNIDPELLHGFVEEARGYLPKMLDGIGQLHREPTDGEHLKETHRLTHSIKGVASMLGLGALSNVAYLVEEALEQIAAGQLPADPDTGEVLADTAASMGRYLDRLVAGQPEDLPMVTEAVTAFRRLRGLPPSGDREEIRRLCPDVSPEVAPAPSSPGSASASTSSVSMSSLSTSSVSTPSASAPPSPYDFGGSEGPNLASSGGIEREAAEAAPSMGLLESFREEARDHLAQVGSGLRRLEQEPADREALGAVRRSIHTLKGAASMVGRPRCAGLAHRMEDLLDLLHESKAPLEREQLDLLFATADTLEDLVEGAPGPTVSQPLEELLARYASLLPDSEAPGAELESQGTELAVEFEGAEALAEAPASTGEDESAQGPMVRIPIARLDEVVRLLSELVVSGSTFERYYRQLSQDVGELRLSTGHLKRLSHRFESEYEAFALTRTQDPLAVAAGGIVGGSVAWHPAASPVSSPSTSPEFDELELDRYTEIHRISRQLGESASDLNTLESGLRNRVGDFEGYMNRVSRLTGEIQDKVMRLRMVPFAQLSSRLHRVVRVTARNQGKQVDLQIEGENTALDKTVLEEISDPLLHLLRNAVGHGIESPSQRREAGKGERGKIRLRAAHEGTQVVIEVTDDGAGIDPERLRARAVEMGLVAEVDAALAAPEALHRWIFEPGFSTAPEVSEVSGRGVGLDVVQSVVHRLEGTVRVHSNPGRGTTLTIRLPLTLAVIRAILVRSGEQTFALPLAAVREILRLESDDLERLGQDPVVRVRNHAYPAVHLSEAIGQPVPQGQTPRRRPCLILDLGERRLAILVDRIVEARDVVVKNLGNLLRRVPGVNGATLMGDGSVVLILNPQDLAGAVVEEPLPSPTMPPPALTRPAPNRPLEVLVVDDSVSVRRVLSNLVRGQGWNAITARDGLEALETIEGSQQLPDAILLDIEMPRMDGYELTTALRARQIYRQIPIVILTSRAGQKHRQRAFEAGANEYLVKPYQDDVLIQLLRRLQPSVMDGNLGTTS